MPGASQNTPDSRLGAFYSFTYDVARRANSEHSQTLVSVLGGLLVEVKITPTFRNYIIDKFMGTYRVGKKQYSVDEVEEDIYHSEEARRDLLFRMYRGDLTPDGQSIFGTEGAVYEILTFNNEYDLHMSFVSISQGLSYRKGKMRRHDLEFTVREERRPEELGANTEDLSTRRKNIKDFRKDLKRERRGLRKWTEEFKALHSVEMPIVVEKEYPYPNL